MSVSHRVAMALYPASDQFLVAAPTVGIRAVKKIDADLTRSAQGFDRRISVGLVVERRHRRAAETDRGNLEPAKPAPLHPSASSTPPNQDPAQHDRCSKPARQLEAVAARAVHR